MNYRTLIFDDEKEIRQILWTLFDDRGYEVLTFPHPGLCPLSEAYECPCPKGQACSDIIISDVEMPCMDGYTLVTSIRKSEVLKDLHVILHSSLSGGFNKALVEKVGADRFSQRN